MPTIPVFSQYIYVGQTENNDKVKEAFMPFLMQKERYFHSPWKGARCYTSCQHDKNNEMPWNIWLDNIRPCLEEFIKDLEPMQGYSLDVIENWANIYEDEGFQEVHDHAFPGRSFACSYFLEKDTSPGAGGEFCLNSDSHTPTKYSGLDNIFKKFHDAERYIPDIKEGSIIIFPCWLKHYTFPNHSNKRRTTFSANFRVNNFTRPNNDNG